MGLICLNKGNIIVVFLDVTFMVRSWFCGSITGKKKPECLKITTIIKVVSEVEST
jgi:hypothetical protein